MRESDEEIRDMNAFETYLKDLDHLRIVGYRSPTGACVGYELTTEELREIWDAACEWQKQVGGPNNG